MTTARLQEVARFVRSLGTWMDVGINDEGYAEIGTRTHGSVGNEQPGREDIAEGRRVAKALIEKFPDANVELDTVDEWVSVMVDFAPKRYNSNELQAALKAAFPNAGPISRTGGTFEIAEANVPSLGVVRLVSSRDGGAKLDHGWRESAKAILLKSLDPKDIRAAAKR